MLGGFVNQYRIKYKLSIYYTQYHRLYHPVVARELIRYVIVTSQCEVH